MSETRIEQAPPVGMITLRGDFADKAFAEALKTTLGLPLPNVREVSLKGAHSIAWMSPDEVLLITPYQDRHQVIEHLTKLLAKQHHLVADVSDARALFSITGPNAREVIAKGAPVDMSRDAFGPGQIRRSRLGQVAAAFWMTDETTIQVVCFRSVADFVAKWLDVATAPGSEVGFL